VVYGVFVEHSDVDGCGHGCVSSKIVCDLVLGIHESVGGKDDDLVVVQGAFLGVRVLR
jgi:hypothetical protein